MADTDANWTLNRAEYLEIILLPIVCTLLIIVILYFWPAYELEPEEELQKPPTAATTYTINPVDPDLADCEPADREHVATEDSRLLSKKNPKILQPGDEGGDYTADWTTTFDLVLAIFMALSLALLIFFTTWLKPQLWTNYIFWLYQAPKPALMMGIGVICGLLCRHLCGTDDRGYILSGRNKWFKVNYTRKVQHFAAYLIPLILPVPASCKATGTLETAWGQWVTILCFALLIKPIRERSSFFMLQFNSMDRPEDRPHTLKWIIGGNIIPGTLCILFFRHLFAVTQQEDLTLIFIFVTGLGDGLAEPIGIAFGRHKYRTRSCSLTDPRKYTRSFEGSACVFISGFVFTATTWKAFHSPVQFWISFILMPFTMTMAEAWSPHTMDTPFLMGLGGLLLYVDIKVFK